ncbi:MAG: hypothetical protein IT222_08570 [Crocinitomix sp.]|nr:hypothetical protein [Crocinitomix sp.]
MRPSKKETSDDHFKNLHKDGFKGLWKIYSENNSLIKRPIIISFLLTSVICFIVAGHVNGENLLILLDENINIGLALEGGLIGLTLAGLTLIVTFGSDKLMIHLVRDNLLKAQSNGEFPKYSVYQRSVAKFTFAVMVQVITLLVLFITNIFLKLNLSFSDELGNQTVNILCFFLCLFLMFYSLILVFQMTLNIFTISQINHSVLSKEEMLKITDEEAVKVEREKHEN